jgi:hypothetical protein
VLLSLTALEEVNPTACDKFHDASGLSLLSRIAARGNGHQDGIQTLKFTDRFVTRWNFHGLRLSSLHQPDLGSNLGPLLPELAYQLSGICLILGRLARVAKGDLD